MTEQLTSPSNSSIDPNLLRLNSSSCCMVSPSQSNFGSYLKQNLIHFEEYKCQESPEEQIVKKSTQVGGLVKKKLTIMIDESYDESSSKAQPSKPNRFHEKNENNKPKPEYAIQIEDYPYSSQSKDIGALEVISPIENRNFLEIIQLQQRITELESKQSISMKKIEQKDEKISSISQKCQNIKAELQRMQHQLVYKESQIKQINQKYQQKQIQNQKLKQQITKLAERQLTSSFICEVEQKMKEIKQKETKNKELWKINEKLKNLNKDLIRQLKSSEKKVRDLQKQMQNSVCMMAQENINRMKESSLKMRQKEKQKQNHERLNVHTNHHTKTERDSIQIIRQKQSFMISTLGSVNNQLRKSLDRKKGGTSAGQLSQPKKNGIKVSSCSNSNIILNKKLTQK